MPGLDLASWVRRSSEECDSLDLTAPRPKPELTFEGISLLLLGYFCEARLNCDWLSVCVEFLKSGRPNLPRSRPKGTLIAALSFSLEVA